MSPNHNICISLSLFYIKVFDFRAKTIKIIFLIIINVILIVTADFKTKIFFPTKCFKYFSSVSFFISVFCFYLAASRVSCSRCSCHGILLSRSSYLSYAPWISFRKWRKTSPGLARSACMYKVVFWADSLGCMRPHLFPRICSICSEV